MSLSTFDPGAPVSEIMAAYDKDGGVILGDFLTPEQVARLRAEIEPRLAKAPAGAEKPQFEGVWEDFAGTRTKRISRVLSFSPTFPEVLEHRLVHELLEATLLRQWQNVWLGTGEVISVGPGEQLQALHRDELLYSQFLALGPDGPNAMVNFMIALTDFKDENGATRVIPGSHRWDDLLDFGSQDQTVPAEMRAGSVLFYPGKTAHGAGANRTNESRLCLSVSFNLGYLVPEEAHPFVVPEEVARKLSPRVQQMIGHRSFYQEGGASLWTVDREELADYLKLDS